MKVVKLLLGALFMGMLLVSCGSDNKESQNENKNKKEALNPIDSKIADLKVACKLDDSEKAVDVLKEIMMMIVKDEKISKEQEAELAAIGENCACVSEEQYSQVVEEVMAELMEEMIAGDVDVDDIIEYNDDSAVEDYYEGNEEIEEDIEYTVDEIDESELEYLY